MKSSLVFRVLLFLEKACLQIEAFSYFIFIEIVYFMVDTVLYTSICVNGKRSLSVRLHEIWVMCSLGM